MKFWLNPLWTIIVLKVIAHSCVSVLSEEAEDLVSTTVIEALVDRNISLPCNISTDSKDDRVYMVLWFRNTGGKPLYRYQVKEDPQKIGTFDLRGRAFTKALHWSDPLEFGPRARFLTNNTPAVLYLKKVDLEDDGVYRCRVDFKNTPTRNFQIRLKVTVPPHQMLLYDEMKRDIAGVIGPLQVGANFTMFCEVKGGIPQPNLMWMFDKTPIEDYEIVKADENVVISMIQLIGAQRNWLNSTVRCVANNTNLLSPYQRIARIEMSLRPTSAALLTKPTLLYADKEVTMICVCHGSRPPAEMIWLRNNRLYNHGRQHKAYRRSETINDTSVISQLTFKPQPEDHNVTLKCRAENIVLGVSLEDSFLMHVLYKPVVNLTLGSTLQANEIKEGDDVYFECNVKANPKEYRINWYHDSGTTKLIDKTPRRGQYIKGTGAGIFTSTKSLVLQKVDRSNSGLYSCVAANEMGETKSADLYLRIQYAPVCSQPSPMLIGARIDEHLRIRCLVKADPADVNFTWLFNNSGESFEVSPHRYGPGFMVSHGGTASELKYCASSERDYGTLTCLSKNSVGDQHKPCIFQLVPATRPSPPRNCTVLKIPRRVEPLLAIKCLAGYDGGIRQHFTLETTGQPSQVLVNTSAGYQDIVVWLNVTWSDLQDISDDKELMVIARNAKGSSESIVLHGVVFKDPVKETEEIEVAETKVPIAVTLIAMVALVAGAGATAACICKKRPDISSATAVSGKRPSQSVVQMDSQGRKYMFTYPDTSDKDDKPDILLPKSGDPAEVTDGALRNRYVSREVISDNQETEIQEITV